MLNDGETTDSSGGGIDDENDDAIQIAEFFEFYSNLKLVHINLMYLKFNARIPKKQSSRWDFKQIFGKWLPPKTPPKSEEFIMLTMPQHNINLKKADDQDRSMIVSLMAIDYSDRRKQNKPLASIQFHVFKLNKRRGRNASLTFSRQNYALKDLKKIGKSDEGEICNGEREICKRFIVTQGVYVIVPCLKNQTNETPYLLRVFSENIKIANDSDDEDESNDDNGELDEVEDFDFIDDHQPDSDEIETDEEEDKNLKPKKSRTKLYLPRIKKK